MQADKQQPALRIAGPLTTATIAGPAWASNLPIYEVNLDLYGFPRGTALRAYEKHLPVLKDLGVGLIWFMPLHPRGEQRAFGSPYAVRDYRGIHPAFGTPADFKHLVGCAHALGLRVLMDWVPNHTAWDNPLLDAQPAFYATNAQGEIAQAGTWFDVAQLDYGTPGHWNKALWQHMRDDMLFWIRTFDIDGFRCDAAGRHGMVPVEFWTWLRPQLNAVKPVFMLAEGDDRYLHPAFDMTYAWNLPPVLWEVCAGRKPATAIDDELRNDARDFPAGAIRMRFLDNHDWHANTDWCWGRAPAIATTGGMLQVAPLMVLCATLPGKPLLYNGQEMSYTKVDPAPDATARYQSPAWPFYHRLLELYQSQPAIFAGTFAKIASNHDDKLYMYVRQRGRDRVVVVVNLSDQPQTATVRNVSLAGDYRDWFGNCDVTLAAQPTWNLAPWAYRVYVRRAD
ncbi:MAG: alpha-amylase family glycosyl hydrolase [bacterium]|nr:alpha-amylase family glycosyl hydrolase [bacterium]